MAELSEKQMKVTDRRMFTTDGELRQEFQHLESAPIPDPAAPAVEEVAEPEEEATAGVVAGEKEEYVPPAEVQGFEAASGRQAPGFLDLVGMLAEPAGIYLREASMGKAGDLRATSQLEQNLHLAKLHIDMLGVLHEKVAGNLEPQEKAMLEDVIYRLRVGYVQTKE